MKSLSNKDYRKSEFQGRKQAAELICNKFEGVLLLSDAP